VHFLAKKVDDLSLVVALRDCLNIPPNPAKNYPKNLLLLWLGVHFVTWGALTHFSFKLCLEKFFSPPWGGAGAPTAPLATPMVRPGRVLGLAGPHLRPTGRAGF